MKTKDKIIFGLAILAIFCWLVFLIKSVLTPFVCSLIIAYFLDPLVDYLVSKKVSRTSATALILGLFLASFITICVILLPIIYGQFSALSNTIPQYFHTFTNDFYPQIIELSSKIGINLQPDFSHLIANQELTAKFVGFSKNIFDNAINSSVTIINVFSIIFITPILVFYLLKDWDILVGKVNNYLPRNVSSSVQEIAKDINKTLSGYVRGQFHVCLILGIIYSTFLSFSGLNFGFLIGFLTGLFSFIPFIGMISGVTSAIIVALFQWGFDLTQIGIITGIFIFGQIVESNFLTPKLIGSKIGLHPVWIIFGLFVFGALFGFMGILFAVPLTAIFGVIIKYFALKYKKRFA